MLDVLSLQAVSPQCRGPLCSSAIISVYLTSLIFFLPFGWFKDRLSEQVSVSVYSSLWEQHITRLPTLTEERSTGQHTVNANMTYQR